MRIVSAVLAAVIACGAAIADPIYTVIVDTSSINGQIGFLDFQLAPGFPQPPQGTVTISGFTSDGVLGAAELFGNVLGTLDDSVVIENDPTTLTNEFLTSFTFGAQLQFALTLSGSMITNPDATSGSSTFAFAMWDGNDPANPLLVPIPLPADDLGGFALVIDVQNDGTLRLSNFMTTGTMQPGLPNPVPEPGALLLVAAGLGLGAALRSRGA